MVDRIELGTNRASHFAYDRLRWEFIEETLVDIGLSTDWVKWIATCVYTGSMRLS